MIKENELELVERYLSESLSNEELVEFEQRLKQDMQFREQVKEAEVLMAGVRQSGRKALRNHLEELDEKLPEVIVKPMVNWKYYVAIAAGILLLAGFFRWWDAESHHRLFQQNFSPYANVILPIQRGGDAVNEELMRGMMLYEGKQFEDALPSLLNYQKDSKDNNVLFYIGITRLATGDANQAITDLQHFIEQVDQDHSFYSPAQWYLALAYLSVGEVEIARQLLRKLAIGNREFSVEAANLLQDISE